ncbi:unnamed protein product [Protopolystoma xenopodis]|uniref:Uncharacterized protein n=1 Tax=Protopolystoma xenopodis TaxID=117903 RepID=A0A3S5AAF3_9PLAT|nr:unnamed protein product [Protopolystoma xenopodis]
MYPLHQTSSSAASFTDVGTGSDKKAGQQESNTSPARQQEPSRVGGANSVSNSCSPHPASRHETDRLGSNSGCLNYTKGRRHPLVSPAIRRLLWQHFMPSLRRLHQLTQLTYNWPAVQLSGNGEFEPGSFE